MRRAAAVLVLLLTSTAAQAAFPSSPRTEEIQLYCSMCMVIPFAVLLFCVLGMLVIERRNRHNAKPPRRPPSPTPTRTAPPPGN